MISIRYYISDIKKKKKKVRKTTMKNSNQEKLEALSKKAREIGDEAFDLIAIYLDDEDLSLDDIKEDLARLKKRYIDTRVEAAELM